MPRAAWYFQGSALSMRAWKTSASLASSNRFARLCGSKSRSWESVWVYSCFFRKAKSSAGKRDSISFRERSLGFTPRKISKCRTWAGTGSRKKRSRLSWKGLPAAITFTLCTRFTSSRTRPRLLRQRRITVIHSSPVLLRIGSSPVNFIRKRVRNWASGFSPTLDDSSHQTKSMLIIPAIDLKDGRCVRLVQGEMDKETIYFENPVDAAQHWRAEGATFIHVVDLNGAVEGRPVHTQEIEAICKQSG